MKTLLGLMASACVLALASACAPQQPAAPTNEQLVERGQYLVTAIGGCNDCHTPQTPTGPDMAHALQGAPLGFELVPALQGHVPWVAVAPPIAGGPVNWSDEQFATFLQTGVRPDGSHPNPPMPAFRLNADDARAVVAYIKTVPRADTAPASTTP